MGPGKQVADGYLSNDWSNAGKSIRMPAVCGALKLAFSPKSRRLRSMCDGQHWPTPEGPSLTKRGSLLPRPHNSDFPASKLVQGPTVAARKMLHLQWFGLTLRYFRCTLMHFGCTLKSFILVCQPTFMRTARGLGCAYKPHETKRLEEPSTPKKILQNRPKLAELLPPPLFIYRVGKNPPETRTNPYSLGSHYSPP